MEARKEEARALGREGRFEEALDAWLAMHRDHPDDARTMTRLGYLQRERGLLDDSVYWFRRAAATGQDWYDYLRLAVSYTDLGDLGGTRWATERLEVESSLPGAGTAMWLLFSEQWDELAQFAVEHLEAGGEPWFWRELAAYSAVLTGSYSEALDLFRADYPELFEATPHLAPGRPTAPLWIAYCYQRQGDPERAEALIRLVLAAVHPTKDGYDRVYSKSYRAVAYALLGQDQQALTEFRKAIDGGLRVRLFDNVVLYERLPFLDGLQGNETFRALMAEMKTRNARMIASLDDPRVARSDEDLEAIRGAVFDYVEGLYDLDPLRIEQGVDPRLRRIGFLYSEEEGAYRRTEEMSFAQLRARANRWNADGHLDAAEAVKEVVVLEMLDATASARVTAAWGVDFVHLAKIGGQWKIVNILWQSPPRLP